MENIQAKAVETFAKNMDFFSTYDEKLFQKLSILQQAIETAQYRENYALEYKDGYFDVKNLQDNSWLYGANSTKISKDIAQEINWLKTDSALSLGYRYDYTDAMVEDLGKFTSVNFSSALIAPIEKTVSNADGRANTMKKIYKFAFLGLGLGLHISMIDERIKADSYLFVEDNLELFYLTLFVVDYKKLSENAQLFFCVMENSDGFKNSFDAFYEDMLIRNDFLKFHLFDDAYAMKIKQMQSITASKSHLAYPFHLLLRKNIYISKVLQGGYKFLNIGQIYQNSPLKDKKVLFLAAGPSLDKHIDKIKQNRQNFFIVAVFMIAKKLHDASIKPDIFLHVDENETSIQRTLSRFSSYEYFKDTLFIFSASVPIGLFSGFVKKEKIYFVEDRTRYKENFGFLDFYSVGEAGYMLCLILGANELYLLGLDLALGKSGQTHATGHNSSDKVIDTSTKDEVQEVASIRESVLDVKANRGGLVSTTPLFEVSIRMMNVYSSLLLNHGQKVYNLSDGAFFDGTIPFAIEEIETDHECCDKEELCSFLNDISQDFLTDKEKNNLHVRKQEMKKKAKIIRKFKESNIKSVDEFHTRFLKLIGELITPVNKSLIENSDIFTNYFKNTASFVGEYLNTQEAVISPKTLKQVKDVIVVTLEKLLAGFGYMEFGYLNPHKYFEPSVCKELEDRVLTASWTYQTFSQAKEICFSEKIHANSNGKLLENIELKPLEEKSGVGFLATMVNLSDKEYMAYLERILQEVDGVDLVAFYFEEHQKAAVEDRFKEFKERVACKEVNGIDDIVNGCRVYIGNVVELKFLDSLIFYSIRDKYFDTIYAIQFSENVYISVKEHEAKHSSHYKFLSENIQKLGIHKKSSDNSLVTEVVFKHIKKELDIEDVKFDLDMSIMDFTILWIKIGMKSVKNLATVIKLNKDMAMLSKNK